MEIVLLKNNLFLGQLHDFSSSELGIFFFQ